MPGVSESRLELSLRADLILINLEQDGSLEKSYRENEAHRLLEPYDNSNNARQHAFFDSHPLTYLKKWKRLKLELSLGGCLQRNDFRF